MYAGNFTNTANQLSHILKAKNLYLDGQEKNVVLAHPRLQMWKLTDGHKYIIKMCKPNAVMFSK